MKMTPEDFKVVRDAIVPKDVDGLKVKTIDSAGLIAKARKDAKRAGVDLDHEYEDLTCKYQRDFQKTWKEARKMARETLHLKGSSNPLPWYMVKRPYVPEQTITDDEIVARRRFTKPA
jgi:hypothetical protein